MGFRITQTYDPDTCIVTIKITPKNGLSFDQKIQDMIKTEFVSRKHMPQYRQMEVTTTQNSVVLRGGKSATPYDLIVLQDLITDMLTTHECGINSCPDNKYLKANTQQTHHIIDAKYRRIQNAQHAMQRNFKGRKR